jgi:hypothetical protein
MRIFLALIAIIVMVSCGNNASVEFGMNDETLKDGAAGDLRMKVLKVELPDGADYVPVWEGIEYVQVELQSSDFVSITSGYEGVEPKSYSSVRVTVDSLTHVQQTSSTLLIDTAITFVAQAFTPIVISGNNDYRLVVVIAAEVWFDEDSLRIIPGHEPFENAALRIFYEY